MTPMQLVYVMPLWQRHELTALILRQWHQQILRLRGQVDVHLVCVGSEGLASSCLVTGYTDGMSYVEAPNDPLNQKWNKGLQVARWMNPDAVLIIGSDDLVSDSLHVAYAEKLRAGLDCFGLLDLYSRNRLAAHGVTMQGFRLADLNAKAVDIKADVSITPFARIPYVSAVRGRRAVAWMADLMDADSLAQLQTRWRAAA